VRRRWLRRATFVAAGIYNIAWGCYAFLDPQWFFRITGPPLSNSPQVFACLGMVLGRYGVLYPEVARHPEHGWPAAAVGLTGKVLGPLGLAWLIVTGVWPISTGRAFRCGSGDDHHAAAHAAPGQPVVGGRRVGEGVHVGDPERDVAAGDEFDQVAKPGSVR
jgi:hypothetical protein